MSTNSNPVQEHNFWQTHVAQWQNSGLTQAAYCRQHDLAENSLSYHKRKLINGLKPIKHSSPGFISVQLVPAIPREESLVVHLGNGVSVSGITPHNLTLVKQLAEVLL